MTATGVVIVAYDAGGPGRFEAERALLEQALAPWLAGGLHHIGSTSIPGVAAKPVIDMLAGVRELERARAAFAPLAEAGYEYKPHRPWTHHFSKGPAPARTHQLHLTEPGSDRLAFRDALRAHPELAAEYAELKLRLPATPAPTPCPSARSSPVCSPGQESSCRRSARAEQAVCAEKRSPGPTT